mgnify:CR=1 FL=1
MKQRKRITILGVTGSIGQSTRSLLIESDDSDQFETIAVTAQTNVEALAHAAIELGAKIAAIGDVNRLPELQRKLDGTGIRCLGGPDGLVEAAKQPVDMVLSAITGAAALPPTLAAIQQGADIALANKESIVCAGRLLLDEAEKSGSKILPVDSEHNAIFQVLDRKERVEKLILTASGGPFRTATREQIEKASPEQAIAHPNWSMGAKISVDSATLMNKGLELIEASYLFDVPETMIDVLIHPQSIIHSLVSYSDGSVLAQLGMPDMRTPISYALAWPDRMQVDSIARLDLTQIAQLDFAKPNTKMFPALNLARLAVRHGAAASNVFNAVNEVGVASFLEKRIGFLQIAQLVEDVLEDFVGGKLGLVNTPSSFEEVYQLDAAARRAASDKILATV